MYQYLKWHENIIRHTRCAGFGDHDAGIHPIGHILCRFLILVHAFKQTASDRFNSGTGPCCGSIQAYT